LNGSSALHTPVKFDELFGHPVSSRNGEMIAKLHDRVTADRRKTIRKWLWKKKIAPRKGILTKNSGPDTFIDEFRSTAADSEAVRAPVGCSL